MMKRLSYYILLLLSCLFCACNEVLPDGSAEEETGEKTVFVFKPTFIGDDAGEGVATKAFGNNPGGDVGGSHIQNIYFAVFDQAGYKLSEYAKAIPMKLTNSNDEECQYSVELTTTKQRRVIHIIANAPEHLPFGSEAEVIGSLTTRFDANESDAWQDAYWDRIELPKGVPSASDTQGYNEVMGILSSATLVRNFARIVVDDKVDNGTFELTRFWITNFPDRGSIAPYNRATRAFQVDYKNWGKFDDLIDPGKGNYHGYSPATAKLLSLDDLVARGYNLNSLAIDKNAAAFCYERETPSSNPLYLIIAGKYNGSGDESFYKIDLLNHNDEYFPLLRNFSYKVNITDVQHAGASTIEGALSSDPSGNIDASLEMKDLTNISDGVAQIFVNETSAIIVDDNNPVQLRYKFIPDIKDATDGIANRWNSTVKRTEGGEEHGPYVTITRSNGSTGAVFATLAIDGDGGADYDNDDQNDHYRVITLTPIQHGDDIVRTETITVTGYYWNNTRGVYESISRDVVYQRRNKFTAEVSLEPSKVQKLQGQQMDLVISLEAGLPSSMFSLDFRVEAAGLTVTTSGANSLPVEVHASNIPGNEIPGKGPKPAYSFIKTISWTEYKDAPEVDGRKIFRCTFETNTSDIPSLSAFAELVPSEYYLPETKSGDLLYVTNKYFYDTYVHYYTYDQKQFRNISFTKPAIGVSADMTFNMAEGFTGTADVIVGVKGLDPTNRAGVEYLGVDSDGFEQYKITVSSSANPNGSIGLTPYQNTVSIKLSADEYRTETNNY